MKKISILFIFIFLQISLFAQTTGEHYLKIYINDHSELETLTQMVSIDNVVKNEVFAYANNKQLEKLTYSLFEFEELEHPSLQASKLITMATTVEQMANWDRYPTYSVYNQLMYNFTTAYPNLCKLDTPGTSILNRNILALNITSNINTPQPKPEVLLSSTMHGDEVTGWMLCMRLAHYLLSNYGTNSQVTNMLDSVSIFIAPNTNPDGTYRYNDNAITNPTRSNIYNVDLNRNFPDPWKGLHPDGEDWQKETVVMMDYAESRHFILGMNYHGGTEVANYPWDGYKSNARKHPDDIWFYQICREYAVLAQTNGASSNYFKYYNNLGVTEGGDWYVVYGGRQDYMNYFHNCKEITLEVSATKTPGSETMPNYWNWNRDAMLAYIENAKYGIRGLVTNTDGEPLNAKVTVLNHDNYNSHVFTNPQFGNYYRMIQPGTFNLLFESDGYISQTISGIASQLKQATPLNVVMHKIPNANPYINPRNVVLETEEAIGKTQIMLWNVGSTNLTFSTTVENAQSNTWLSLSNNSGVLTPNQNQEIVLSYNFNGLPYGQYTTRILIDVVDSVIYIPVSIRFIDGSDEEYGIPYITPKNIDIETTEVIGNCVVTMKNIGNKAFSYHLAIDPEECYWLSLQSVNSGTLEAAEELEILLSYNLSPPAKEIYLSTLMIDVIDSVISVPVRINHLIGIPSLERKKILMYPNPTTGVLNLIQERINNEKFTINSVEVFDIYGRKQEAESRKQNVVDISDLAAGIYFVKIITEDGIFVEKIIKK